MKDALRRKIFAGCKVLGLDTDARRDLQLLTTGKGSLSDMTERELNAMVEALKNHGFKPVSKGRYKPAPRKDLRLIHVLWRLLGEAGHLDNPTRAGLNAFIRRRFGDAWGAVPRDVDDLRDWDKIDAVIQALVKWCERKGVHIDNVERGR